MRVILGAMVGLVLLCGTASGQSLVLQASGGPTITDPGYSVAAGLGFAPTSRLTVFGGVDRTHLSSQITPNSASRGGTFTLATLELRATILGHDRVSPYVFGGAAAGVSRPNVNANFPDPVTNTARALFFGGGIQAPLGERLSVFGDVRMTFGVEGTEGILAAVPVRAGVAWRF